ncbi:MAG TPA: sulfatase [Firmicutes bacterium]|jgi:N-sulfoglucosamine sulfohydrolase|nr:sulfatase [Bacillota bacterium]
MICHDLGRFLGCYGIPTVRTPNIDTLAQEGALFRQSFCTAPQCSPSRAALFTGLHPHSNGVMGLTHRNFAWDLKPDVLHLGQIMRNTGYGTALIGVHHESRSGDRTRIAQRCGMDEYVPGGTAPQVAERVVERLQRYKTQDKPFYLQVGFTEPHRRLGPDDQDYAGFLGDYIQVDASLGVTVPPYLQDTAGSRTEMAEIQGAVHVVDVAVGRILTALEELGQAQNTIVVFTTDHGLALPRAKCTLYDPGIETALIMRYPQGKWQGAYDQLVSNIDILPTLLDTVGIPQPESLQGRSLIPLLQRKDAEWRDRIFAELTYHEYYDPCRCIRTERYKLIVFFSAAPAYMDCSQSYHPRSKPIVPAAPRREYHPLVELYDLRNDPWEQVNLAGNTAYAEIEQSLLRQLHAWMIETDDPLLQSPVPSPMHHWAIDKLMGVV